MANSALQLTLPEATAALGSIHDHALSFKSHMQSAEDTLAKIVSGPASGEFVKEFANRWIANAEAFGEGYSAVNRAGAGARDKFNNLAQISGGGQVPHIEFDTSPPNFGDGITPPGNSDHIAMNYEVVSQGLEEVTQVLGQVEAAVGDLQAALGSLAQFDTGDSADVFQQDAKKSVEKVEQAQQDLRGGLSFMDDKMGEFSAAEASAIASFGNY
ncbi:WXG100 family type VII secretion target [Mycobacteroides chelonae]|jgi:uncharacterized protein YukE|uniref:WXG100 family type VII secretion target n=1 Tax=Mycobacteroides chelonae TaxID=1774 RepID=A0AB73M608_MYCCH|nr:hypothetical protein [Mycobacteroides chelonae]MBF9325213.1 hypothetical protein [Mycobacteroides chelonae]MBF9419389.1 hypothetical protein [Mycobacteroides chelonae]MBF9437868.1 hypothetical protein [Mycobacteroides chelonae]MBV6359171.1 hypothetical protein [Mycobacteroides chelonae]MEC4835231.1 hypothetical protein [Mycobacteroides chelonae]